MRMLDLTGSTYALLFVGIVFIFFILWLGWRLRIAWKRFLFSLLKRRGRIGEDKAVKLLKKNDYSILQDQVPLSGFLSVDGVKLDFHVRVDYLVERNGIKYLAEVKTGEAANPKNRGTRRQLLEYALLSGSEVVLLVDPIIGRVLEIRFSYTRKVNFGTS